MGKIYILLMLVSFGGGKMLSCSCGEWDGDGVGHYAPNDFTVLKTKRRKRCISCKAFIDIGAPCLEFERMRYPKDDIEIKIYGDDAFEIELASVWMCEKCGETYLNLSEIGYCLDIDYSMEGYLKSYQEMTGFKKAQEVKRTTLKID